jgi:hypothetical protein
MTATPHGERFFFAYSLTMFLIVVSAFPIHALINGGHLPPIRPILHLHALALGSWYALMVLQTGLIGRGRFGLHKGLGIASLLLVGLMLPTGIWVSYENMLRTGDNTILIANSANVSVFLIFYTLGLVWRARAALHKRFMLYAGLALMLPAFARVAYIFKLNDFMVLPMWLAFLLAIPVYDLITERKIKTATAIGVGINLLYIATLLMVGPPPE